MRTLPLSLSGIVVGCSLAASHGYHKPRVTALALLTTVLLQILSNLANDYGDGMKGTDNADRIGPQRAIQSGAISPKAMLRAIIIFSLLSLLSGLALIFEAFGSEKWGLTLLFIVLGLSAIAAAIKYTMGKKAYGYSGLGDLFVFIFFGLVSVMGSYYLHTQSFDWRVLLPASAFGLFSVGVLNLNNLRDYRNDKAQGKNTMVVKMGLGNAKLYHELILIVAVALLAIYNALLPISAWQSLYLLVLYPLIRHAIRVYKVENLQELDPELKTLALTTFACALLFSAGQLL